MILALGKTKVKMGLAGSPELHFLKYVVKVRLWAVIFKLFNF